MDSTEEYPGSDVSPVAQRILAIDAEIASLDQLGAKERASSIACQFTALSLLAVLIVWLGHAVTPDFLEYGLLIFAGITLLASTERVQRYLNKKGRQQLRLERELRELTRADVRIELPEGEQGAQGPAQPSA